MTKTIFLTHRLAPIVAILIAGCSLTACAASGSGSSDSAARFFVAPGKYDLYNCAQLAQQSKATAAREHELEGLMARAGASSSGELVNAVAYRPEYLTVRGEMMDLRQAAADKKCDFVPGEPAAQPANRRTMR